MLKALRSLWRWFVAGVTALFAPSLAALATAYLYIALYGVRAEAFFVVQLYVGYFVVFNLVLAPKLAGRRAEHDRDGAVALVALGVSALSVGVLLAARVLFPAWPPAALTRDLLFVGGAALIAALSYGLAAILA